MNDFTDTTIVEDNKSNKIIDQRIYLWLLIAPTIFFFGNLFLFILLFQSYFFYVVLLAYNFNTLIVSSIFVLSGLWILFKKRNQRTYFILSLVWVLIGVSCFGSRIYASHIEPYRLQIKKVHFSSSKINQPIKILHISDIQSGGIGKYEERVFKEIKKIDPDLILHSGDLLQPLSPKSIQSELPKVARLFSELNPTLGMYSVFGDTDGGIQEITPRESGGLHFIKTENVEIGKDDIEIHLMGLTLYDSADGLNAKPKILKWFEENQNGFTILMGHRPDFVSACSDLKIDLCLAGHTHGGQIRIPFIGPLVTFSRLPKNLARGFHQVGNTHLNVSAGIGAEHAAGLPSIRFNCPPEITVINVKPEK